MQIRGLYVYAALSLEAYNREGSLTTVSKGVSVCKPQDDSGISETGDINEQYVKDRFAYKLAQLVEKETELFLPV